MSKQYLFVLLSVIVVIFCARPSEANYAMVTASVFSWCGDTSCYDTGFLYQCVDLTREWSDLQHGIASSTPCFPGGSSKFDNGMTVHVLNNGTAGPDFSIKGELNLPFGIKTTLPIKWLRNRDQATVTDPLPFRGANGEYCEVTVNYAAGSYALGNDACYTKPN